MTQSRIVGGRYELGELIGYGGMAEVHRGRDTRLNREVAIKVLRADLARDPSFLNRFRREAHSAAGLNHPSIVAVYDTGEDVGPDGTPQPFIVMEFVEGRTLRDIVKSEGRLPVRRAMEIVADVCAALDFSHRNGIIHRDIKPANVMITPQGAVKVMDFGIARAVADNSATVTQTANVIGTAQYLSPEQARGETVDPRSDVYSTGCLLYEMVTGVPPFQGDSPVAVAYQHVRENPPPPSTINPDVPPELDAIVLKAMAKNPANRYQSAGEMRADLIRAINGRPVEAEPVMTADEVTTVLGGARTGQYPAAGYGTRVAGRPPTGPAKKDRSPWFWVGIIAAALLVIAAGAFGVVQLLGGGGDDVTVPNVVGQTQSQAKQTLEGVGLVPEFTTGVSVPQQKGQVISTDPAAGIGRKKGATVSVVIGAGPAQITLDGYQGVPFEDAAASLRSKGLIPVRNDVNNSARAGQVLSSNPPANSRVSEGARITLNVSTGKTALPDVVGKSEQDATAILNKAGFTDIKRQVVPPPDDQEAGTVFRTDPTANTAVSTDQRVTLFIAKEKPTPTPTTPSPTPSPTGSPTGTPSGSPTSSPGQP